MLNEPGVTSVPFDEGIVSTLPAIYPLEEEESSLTESPMSTHMDSDDQVWVTLFSHLFLYKYLY